VATDPSQYSDEELMQFAGIGGSASSGGLSGYSDDELMQVAAAPLTDYERENKINTLLGAGNSTGTQAALAGVGAASKVIPLGFGDEIVAGVTSATDALPSWLGGGGEGISNAYDRRLQEIRDYQKAAELISKPLTTTTEISGSVALPGGSFTKAKGIVPVLKNIAQGAKVDAASGSVATSSIPFARSSVFTYLPKTCPTSSATCVSV